MKFYSFFFRKLSQLWLIFNQYTYCYTGITVILSYWYNRFQFDFSDRLNYGTINALWLHFIVSWQHGTTKKNAKNRKPKNTEIFNGGNSDINFFVFFEPTYRPGRALQYLYMAGFKKGFISPKRIKALMCNVRWVLKKKVYFLTNYPWE